MPVRTQPTPTRPAPTQPAGDPESQKIEAAHGPPTSGRGAISTPADTPIPELDAAVATVASKAADWAELPIADRRAILAELQRDFASVAERWAEMCRQAEGIPEGSPQAAEEWLAGPYLVIRNLQLLAESLEQIERAGCPHIPGPVRQRPNGQLTAEVFPGNLYDRIFYSGVSAEVWMQPGVDLENLELTMAEAYREAPEGRLCLVLGAGNVSSIGPMDLLYKLFVELTTVVLKMHPVNAYLGPLVEDGFRALVDWGFLRVVYGGAEAGAHLCRHDQVDEIHITGSDKTVEAIVFGPGEEGAKRKAERRPLQRKPISSELGNVSPVIVVPGPWSDSDLAYQAENIASMLSNNAGFNCNAARVLVTHEGWDSRDALRHELEEVLREVPTREAYYPGAEDRYHRFLDAHPSAEKLGSPVGEGELPWVLIPDLDPAVSEDICFREEAFCGVMAETALEAESPAQFLDRAVDFANETLWGTLSATLLIHPHSLRDRETAAAYERALEHLQYGTVAINCWAAVGYGLVVTPWGAYPGHDIYDIQSGSGFVHNTLMFGAVQKAVVRTPFRMRPKPPWFALHRTALGMARKVTRFETDPSPLKLPGIFWDALRG
ncbi:MAG: aldehyde dehydrogenase family protein [Holophagales bacterium]|nr:aldehyde dehydrogenase family protein [Holophagales bacterium]